MDAIQDHIPAEMAEEEQAGDGDDEANELGSQSGTASDHDEALDDSGPDGADSDDDLLSRFAAANDMPAPADSEEAKAESEPERPVGDAESDATINVDKMSDGLEDLSDPEPAGRDDAAAPASVDGLSNGMDEPSAHVAAASSSSSSSGPPPPAPPPADPPPIPPPTGTSEAGSRRRPCLAERGSHYLFHEVGQV